MSVKDKPKFDEAKICAEAIEQMKLGVAIDSAYIRGARSGFEQSRAEIEALELKVRQLESNRTSYIKGLLFEIESKDKRIAELESTCADNMATILDNGRIRAKLDSANAKLERAVYWFKQLEAGFAGMFGNNEITYEADAMENAPKMIMQALAELGDE